ncbi:MAG: hypothetical protein HZB82_07490 [Deltaproteobacteria bacterium]|nr:hypothetical protein [Deltaproteobacteria bacterium]
MQDSVRPVAAGFILGVLCLIFGIFWAIYLIAGHESIHKSLSESAKAAMESKFVVSPSASPEKQTGKAEHGHSDHDMPPEIQTGKKVIVKKGAEPLQEVKAGHVHGMGEHEDPLENVAHERLRRGHIHEMGLGILTIAVSFVLAFLTAPDRVKTFASVCIGFGSFVYPFAWIVMGYRTTAMGLDASAASVLPIAALSVPLVLLGLFITMFYLIKGLMTSHA